MESVVSCVGEPVFKGFLSLSKKLITFIANLKDFDSKISELQEKLEEFHQVLRDTHDTSSETHEWLEKVEDLAYDIEDILDEVDYETKQRQSHLKFSCTNVLLPMTRKLCYKLSNEVKAITDGIEEVNKRKKPTGNAFNQTTSQDRPPQDGPLPTDFNLFGRESEKAEIIDFLLRPNDGEQRYGVIPIVGMGGVGKTTLIQHVFKDEKVVTSFTVTAWAYASMDFDLCRTFKSIIEQISGSCSVTDLCAMQRRVNDEVKNKKFLIILDDLWAQKYSEFQQFLAPLVDAEPGSKVIVTTRDSEIANRIRTAESIVNLNPLSEEDCWSLFRRHSRLETNTRFANIGKEISKKCKGLPLAAVVLGSLLRSKDSEEEWTHVLNDRSWESMGGITSVLKLSYDNLSYCLKSCFAFCTIFPEDYTFTRWDLIEFWKLAGIIKCGKQGETDCKRLGGRYFDELVSRCLLLRQGDDSDRHDYVMHDLIRDMGQQVWGSRYNCYQWETPSSTSWQKARHLSILNRTGTTKYVGKKVLPLRTLRVARDAISKEDTNTLFPKFGKLRQLWLDGFEIRRISKYLDGMRHLRYVYVQRIQELPSEIGRLSSLIRLDIGFCPELTQLPSEIGSLNSLFSLVIAQCPALTQLPSEIGSLNSLSSLVIAFCLTLTQLPSEIGGLSSLSSLEIVSCPELTQLPSEIRSLNSLSSLVIALCPALTQLPSEIGSLNSLSSLVIMQCPALTQLPSEIGSLNSLSYLMIKQCPALTQLPSEIGSLNSLSYLMIMQCPALTQLPSEIGSLNSLSCLMIMRCPALTQLPLEIGSLNSLSFLAIAQCPALTQLPSEIGSMSSLYGLYIWDCEELTQLPPEIAAVDSLSEVSIEGCPRLTEILPPIQTKLIDPTLSKKLANKWRQWVASD